MSPGHRSRLTKTHQEDGRPPAGHVARLWRGRQAGLCQLAACGPLSWVLPTAFFLPET